MGNVQNNLVKGKWSDLESFAMIITMAMFFLFLTLIYVIFNFLQTSVTTAYNQVVEIKKERAGEPISPVDSSNFFTENTPLILSLLGGILATIAIIISLYRYSQNKKRKKRQLFVQKWESCFAGIFGLPENDQYIKALKTRIELAILNQDLLLLQQLEAEFDNELIALEKCKELADSTSLDKRNEVIGKVIDNIRMKQQALSTTDNQTLQMELDILSKSQ